MSSGTHTVLLAVDGPQVTVQLIPIARPCISRSTGRLGCVVGVMVVSPASSAATVFILVVSSPGAAATWSACLQVVSDVGMGVKASKGELVQHVHTSHAVE